MLANANALVLSQTEKDFFLVILQILSILLSVWHADNVVLKGFWFWSNYWRRDIDKVILIWSLSIRTKIFTTLLFFYRIVKNIPFLEFYWGFSCTMIALTVFFTSFYHINPLLWLYLSTDSHVLKMFAPKLHQ